MLGRHPVSRVRVMSIVAGAVAVGALASVLPVAPAVASTTPAVAVTAITPIATRTFSGVVATITDPGGVDAASDYSVTVNWGDGTAASAATTERVGDRILARASHAYSSAGVRTLTVNVDHPLHQAAASGTGTATVLAPLSLAAQAPRPTAGESAVHTVAVLTDVDSPVRPDTPASNARWTDQAYRDLLGREPDPVGRDGTIRFLDGGGSRSDVTNSMVTSREHLTKLTRDLYRQYLGREVDPGALPVWVEAFAEGMSMDRARVTILSSAEYFRLHGNTNGGWVDALYRDLLGRAADPDGRAHHVRLADAGVARDLIVAGMNLSPERRAHTVQRHYQAMLRRPADAGGLAGFVALLADPMAREHHLASFLASSDEYFRRLVIRGDYTATIDWGDGTTSPGEVVAHSGSTMTVRGEHAYTRTGTFTVRVTAADVDGSQAETSGPVTVVSPVNERFVEQAYRDLLGRSADPDGRARALSLLAGGRPRFDVASELVGSDEYRRRVVTDLYRSLLGREPDALGLAFFPVALRTVPEQFVTAFLVSSDEYFRRSGSTNGGFVDALFRDVLGRAPDAPGRALYVALLDRGLPRETTAIAVVDSPEARTRLVSLAYRSFLGRDPDALGNAAFTTLLGSGVRVEAMRAFLVASDEYLGRL